MSKSKQPAKKVDGFFTEARRIIHAVENKGSIRMKLRSRAIVTHRTAVKPIERFNCISCFAPHNVFERNIRGRILRGWLVYKDGRTTVQDNPDPSKPLPCYHNGRLCEACYPKYSIQADSPTDYRSIQLLKDFSKEIRKPDVITPGTMEQEDADQEKELAQLEHDALPKRGRLTLVVAGKNESLHLDEPIDTNAFRRFMLNRKGGLKSYGIKTFDTEVNYDNIKK